MKNTILKTIGMLLAILIADFFRANFGVGAGRNCQRRESR